MAATEPRVETPLVYVETTIPAGMTIAEYRASRPPRKRSRRQRVFRFATRA
jgi:hypothetical protein